VMGRRYRMGSVTRRFTRLLASAAVLSAVLLIWPTPVSAAGLTFTVNRVGDASDLNAGNARCDTAAASGNQCTLRAAIEEANAHAGADVIKFNITSSSKVIRPAQELPTITQKLTINGYSQPGAAPNSLSVGDNAVVKIVLDGANAANANGLFVQANGVLIKGLVIENFDGEAVEVRGSNDTIAGCFIGVDSTGVNAAGKGGGIFVVDSATTTVGGATPAARNVISANGGTAITLIRATGAFIQGNYIGTDGNGAAALGNAGGGINVIDGGTLSIGGATASAGNVISGNDGAGVLIQNSSSDNVVQANRIGTSASGSTDLGNSNNGITLIDSGSDTIGGAGQAGNVVFFNFNGIVVESSNNTVSGNAVEQNSFEGLFIQRGPNTIGGNAVIANSADGIFVQSGDGVKMTGNTFAANGGLAIDLLGGAGESFGVTPNDQDDVDSGPNGLQNFPVITSAHRATNGVVTISGTLNSLHKSQFTLEFYVVVADPHGHGEGFRILGTKS